MKTIRCAVFENHSWPDPGSAEESIYGYRYYTFTSDRHNCAIEVEIISPFRQPKKPCHYYFINDELCDSGFPYLIPFKQRIGILKESPIYIDNLNHRSISRKFPLVITSQKDLYIKNNNYRLIPFSSNFLGFNSQQNINDFALIKKSKLCSMIANLAHDSQIIGYSMRQRVYLDASSYKFVHLYGRSTNPISSKLEALQPYYFSIAMENSSKDYYFTEKIIDCFLTQTIPIYFGCPSIGDYFDKRGILQFANEIEFREIIERLSIELYHDLFCYAKKNLSIAIEKGYSCFDNYLKRVLETVLQEAPPCASPWMINYNIQAKLAAKIRLAGELFNED